ncbi:hypothetical protein [Streptomyces sp. NPDC085937]|uniref:hypothetical protein n=1 Tax=Streptomyces sp. NPDC085937 TaxID=3365742 RepID=UPI0037CDA540
MSPAPKPPAAEHTATGPVPLESLASVLLLSDGATRLVDRFDLADWADVPHVLGPVGRTASTAVCVGR